MINRVSDKDKKKDFIEGLLRDLLTVRDELAFNGSLIPKEKEVIVEKYEEKEREFLVALWELIYEN